MSHTTIIYMDLKIKMPTITDIENTVALAAKFFA